MSLFAIKSASHAANYFEQDGGYYVDNRLEDGTVRDSEWMGALSQKHDGERVSAAAFRRALDGHLPNGESITFRSKDRRPGWDFSLSAPKSISMAALFDERVVDAFNKANREAMKVLERTIEGRLTKNKRTSVERTGSGLIASFLHWNARASKDSSGAATTPFDVSLHRHNIVMNITRRSDRSLGAVRSDRMFEVGQAASRTAFHDVLARELQQLGYRLRFDTCLLYTSDAADEL